MRCVISDLAIGDKNIIYTPVWHVKAMNNLGATANYIQDAN